MSLPRQTVRQHGDTAESAATLRAGDPETTSAAAVLARGEGVVVPPMPGQDHSSLMPFETDAQELRAAVKPVMSTLSFLFCTEPSAKTARSRACWNWRTLPTSARACWAQLPAWIRTS